MADDGLTLEAWSMPHVGALTKKFNFTKYVVDAKFNDRFNDLSDGTIVLPDDFPLKAELFHIDEANHANDVGSMVRVLRGSTPLMHFLVTRSEDTWSDADPTHKLTVEGLEWLLDRATVPHYDHPADPTVEPDWIYGADSILANSGIEGSVASNAIQSFWHNSTGGTFTFSDGTDTTSAIPWDATFDVIANELEADFASITDVKVSGDGTFEMPWVVEWTSPGGVAVTLLTTNGTGLTGGDDIVRTTIINAGGIPSPTGWTISYHPQTGVAHGQVTVLEPSTAQVHSGTYSMRVVGEPFGTDWPGAQTLVAVQGGATYRAEIWVWSPSTQPFRLVIRTLDETLIAVVEATATASTWTKLTIPPFVVPDYLSQVIFRIATMAPGALVWHFDDALLAPGFPEATLGFMMNDVRVAAVAQGVLTWITPTWTTTVDSDGNAWDQNRKWNVNHDQSFLQLWEYVRRWNYEIRIRWDVADARFEWDMWNPNGGGQTRANIAITGKSGVSSSGPIVQRPPDATYMRMEGEAGRWGEYTSTTLDDVWGRLERAQRDRQGVHSSELDVLAERLISRGQDKTASRSVQVEDPSLLPWTAYEPGDTVYLNLAPKDVRKQLRIAACVVSMGGSQATPLYEVHFVSPVLSNDAAMAQGLRYLLREFRRQQAPSIIPTGTVVPPTTPPADFIPTGRPEIIVASFDTDGVLQELADYTLGGDHVTPSDASVFFAGILTDLDMREGDDFGRKGEIIVLDGTYYFNTACTLATNAFGKLTFAGQGGPRFVLNYNTAPATMFINTGGGSSSVERIIRFHNIKFDGNNKSNGHFMRQTTLTAHPTFHVAECVFKDFNLHVWWSERQSPYFIHDCEFYTCDPTDGMFHFDTGTTARRLIHDNNFISCTGNMVSGFDFADHTLIANNTRDQGTLALNAKTGVTYASNLWP